MSIPIETDAKILVSLCFTGENCRYDGRSNYQEEIAKFVEGGQTVAICPEREGGLETPRDPAERKGDRVITAEGEDVTEQFEKGAQETLKFAQTNGCTVAILAKNSPSCGKICYDGSFTRTLTDRPGVTAELLLANNIEVFSQDDL